MTTPGVQAIPGSAAIADLTDRKKFNTIEYLNNGGVVLPEDHIKLYTNLKACYRAAQITDELIALDAEYAGGITGGAPDEERAPLLAERATLAEVNELTALTVHLRAVHPAIDNLIRKQLSVNSKKRKRAGEDDEDFWERYIAEFLAKSIRQIELGSGEIDDHVFTAEEALEMYNSLPEDQAKRLWAKADELSHGVNLANIVVDAGFPGGNHDDAGTHEHGAAAARGDGSNVG